MNGAARVGAAAALLAGSVLLSRALGFVREMVLAHQVGLAAEADAYSAAFQIPDLLNYFLAGGALSIAFVPLYTRARTRHGRPAAQELLGVVLGTVTSVAVLATVVLWVFAEELVALQFPRFDSETRALTAYLTRIVLPAQVAFVAGGIIRAGLMAEGHFISQALAPLLYNAGIIAGGMLLAPRLGIEGFAWGALVGAAAGPLLAALVEARGRLPLAFRIAPLDPRFRNYLWISLPLMLGVTLLTVDEWYDRWFGQLGGEGTIAALRYARQLMLLPVAVVGQAVATAALPTLTRLYEEGRKDELARIFESTLKASLVLAIVCGAGTWLLAEPLVQVVYQRGAFGEEAARAVAPVLAIFAMAVPGWILQQVAVRGFYARGDTWRPMLLGTLVAGLAIPLYAHMASGSGARGLALAGVLAIGVNALLTLFVAQRLYGSPRLGALGMVALRCIAIAGPAVWLAERVGSFSGHSPWSSLLIQGGSYAVACLLLAYAFGDREIRAALLSPLRRMRGSEASR